MSALLAELAPWGEQLTLGQPLWLLALAVLPLLAGWAWRSLAELPGWLRVLSAACRIGFVVCLALALSRPSVERESRRVCATALVDVSESVSDEALDWARRYVEGMADALGGDDTLRVLVFAEETRALDWTRGARWPSSAELRRGVGSGATDVERALQRAAAGQGDGCVARVSLLSDGVATRGDAVAAASELAPPTRLFAVPLRGPSVRDVAVLDVRLPGDVELGAPFEVQVQLRASEETSLRLSLERRPPGTARGQPEVVRELRLGPGVTWVALPSVVRTPGATEFRVALEQDAPDHFPQNDTQSASLDVPGPPRVLIVDGEPSAARHLADALSAQRFDVEVRGPQASPASAAELSPFRFVVLSDVPRSQLSRTAERALVDFVRRGGGLLYSGGAAGYGPGGWQGSELARLLPVTLDDRKLRELPSVALSLVIDRSGSMTGAPLELAKRACIATLEVLAPEDLLEVIAFDGKPVRYVKVQPARYRARIEQEILRIQPGGDTDIFSALDAAFQDLAGVEARRKHVILLTDGNAGADGLHELVANAFADGVGVTAVGLGGGVNEELLRSVAEAGGGRFHHAPEPNQLPRIFTREAELLTEPLEVEDWYGMQPVGRPEVLAGIDWARAPSVRGMAHLRTKSAPAEALLISEAGEPLLARGRAGLGQVLAWTSDLKARWGVDLLRWRDFGKFVAQLVRAHQSGNDERRLPMQYELIGDRLRVWVDAYDSAERFENELLSTLCVGGPGWSSAEFELQLGAPGRYEASLQLPGYGAYSLSAEHRRRSADGTPVSFASSRASVARAYPDEYRRLEPDPAFLRRLAEVGAGEFDPPAQRAVAVGSDAQRERVGRVAPLLWWALGLFLLDLIARRLRLPARAERRAA